MNNNIDMDGGQTHTHIYLIQYTHTHRDEQCESLSFI